MELMGPPTTGFPDLHHYQPFNIDWLRTMIVGKKLRFSNPARFNDPWDCKPGFNSDAALDPVHREKQVQWYIKITRKHGSFPEEEIQRRAQILRDNPLKLKERIDAISASYPDQMDKCWRVYCLSTHPDHELMWAHYAASHTGVCLQFKTRDHLFFQALRVNYLRYYPVIDVADESDEGNLRTIMLTKSRAWKYEEEYRLIAQERAYASGAEAPLITDDSFLRLPDGSLQAIIVGCLAEQATVDAVRGVIGEASYPIALKRVVKLPNRYQLLVTDVT
jgi:Protein of unknown function (DUF2971)